MRLSDVYEQSTMSHETKMQWDEVQDMGVNLEIEAAFRSASGGSGSIVDQHKKPPRIEIHNYVIPAETGVDTIPRRLD